MSIIPNFDLSSAVSDIYYSTKGGLFRADYDHLLSELRELQRTSFLPPSYQDSVVERLINYLLYELPKEKFDRIFSTHKEDLVDPLEKSIKHFLPILAEALLQRNYNHVYKSAFDDLMAFQSIVDTIYKLAVQTTSTPIPPLVAWSRQVRGPFTITAAEIESKIPIPLGVVCLPPEYRNGGLFAWSVMGHEVAGHNFIKSKPDLLDELTRKMKEGMRVKLSSKLSKAGISFREEDLDLLSRYWSIAQRVEELASDLFGILCTGPSLAIGCIGYFRGNSQNGLLKTKGPFRAKKKRAVLHIRSPEIDLHLKDLSEKVAIIENQGILGKHAETKKEIHYIAYRVPSSPHPIEALRPFAMAEAIKQTKIRKEFINEWVSLITGEVLSKEFSTEKVVKIITEVSQSFPPKKEEKVIPFEVACISAEVAANIIITTKLSALGDRKITQLFNWSDEDEALVEFVKASYRKRKNNPPADVSTNHIVAAAIMEASTSRADIENLFQTMKKYLIQSQMKV